jgi:hypothetical protein
VPAGRSSLETAGLPVLCGANCIDLNKLSLRWTFLLPEDIDLEVAIEWRRKKQSEIADATTRDHTVPRMPPSRLEAMRRYRTS